jgi:4-amino-4-deoxychorismate lyase
VQRSIEAIASRKTENQLGKSKEGMTVVLERLRNGGLVAVLEGMRNDKKLAFEGAES